MAIGASMHSEARVEGTCGDLVWRCLVDSVTCDLQPRVAGRLPCHGTENCDTLTLRTNMVRAHQLAS